LTIVVNPSTNSLAIAAPALNPTPVGSPIVPVRFTASGGVPPYLFIVWSGSLPPGITLDPVSGTLSGTPTVTGVFVFAIAVKDKAGNKTVAPSSVLSVTTALTIGVPVLPPAVVGTPYRAGPFTASGGTPPYTWSTSGSLPPGLSINPDTGIISGTPTTAGSSTFTVTLHEGSGVSVTTSTLTITVGRSLLIVPPNLPAGTVGVPYPSSTFTASGGTPPYTFGLASGSLPPGLVLDPKTGILSGTPTAAGTSSFIAQVTDNAGLVAKTISLSMTVTFAPPQLVTSTLPPATAGTAYHQQLQASGGTPPYTWSLASGSLPTGITLDTAGNLTGTTLQTGTFQFTVQVKDTEGLTNTATLSLQVNLPPLPAVTFGGIPATSEPAQQPPFTLTLASVYPLALSGVVTLSFQSSAAVPADDPAIQFVTGGRTAPFTIPAGRTSAVFSVPQMAFSTGTVAGTITLTATFRASGTEITPSPAPSQATMIAAAPPKITSVTIQSTGGATEIVVSGFATSRQVSGAAFNLSISGGSSGSSTVSVDVTNVFAQWYQSAASAAFGSAFVYRQPFTISGPGSITSASVTLTNAQGTSQAVSSQ
jgi:hypothetical protein